MAVSGADHVDTLGSRWGPRLLAVTGTGLGLTAALLDDPGLGYPPGTPAQQSLPGLLQRVMIIAGLDWCVALAGRLLVETQLRPAKAAARSHP